MVVNPSPPKSLVHTKKKKNENTLFQTPTRTLLKRNDTCLLQFPRAQITCFLTRVWGKKREDGFFLFPNRVENSHIATNFFKRFGPRYLND